MGKPARSLEIPIMERSELPLPKLRMECPKCGHAEAYVWSAQLRAADEPEVQFYRCTHCGNTWRRY